MKKKKKQRRKNVKAEVRIPFPNMLAVILVCVTALGLSYVWLCSRCERMGSEIKDLEKTLQTVRQQKNNEQNRWSNLLAPANFQRTLKYHGLAMSLPDERQVVRVRRVRTGTQRDVAVSRRTTQFDAL